MNLNQAHGQNRLPNEVANVAGAAGDINVNDMPICPASCDLSKNHPLSLLDRTKPIASKYFDDLINKVEDGKVKLIIPELVESYFKEVSEQCNEMRNKVLSLDNNWANDAYFYQDANQFKEVVRTEITNVNDDLDHFFYIGYTQFAWLDYLCTTGSKSKKFEEGYKHLRRIKFFITHQTDDINETTLIELYGKDPNVFNAIKSSKNNSEGYVYFVVFAKCPDCRTPVANIKDLIKNAKPHTLRDEVA